jgi:hypothetical protein
VKVFARLDKDDRAGGPPPPARRQVWRRAASSFPAISSSIVKNRQGLSRLSLTRLSAISTTYDAWR